MHLSTVLEASLVPGIQVEDNVRRELGVEFVA